MYVCGGYEIPVCMCVCGGLCNIDMHVCRVVYVCTCMDVCGGFMYIHVCVCVSTLDCLNNKQECTFEVVFVLLYDYLCFMFTYNTYVYTCTMFMIQYVS